VTASTIDGATAPCRLPRRGLLGASLATDPEAVGGQLARALEAIVCRCVHSGHGAVPCPTCRSSLDRATVRRMGRALFAGAGIPLGRRAVTEREYEEIGWLLEQVERLAEGRPPGSGTAGQPRDTP